MNESGIFIETHCRQPSSLSSLIIMHAVCFFFYKKKKKINNNRRRRRSAMLQRRKYYIRVHTVVYHDIFYNIYHDHVFHGCLEESANCTTMQYAHVMMIIVGARTQRIIAWNRNRPGLRRSTIDILDIISLYFIVISMNIRFGNPHLFSPHFPTCRQLFYSPQRCLLRFDRFWRRFQPLAQAAIYHSNNMEAHTAGLGQNAVLTPASAKKLLLFFLSMQNMPAAPLKFHHPRSWVHADVNCWIQGSPQYRGRQNLLRA